MFLSYCIYLLYFFFWKVGCNAVKRLCDPLMGHEPQFQNHLSIGMEFNYRICILSLVEDGL